RNSIYSVKHTISVHHLFICFFFSSRRRHTRSKRDWSSDVCSSDLAVLAGSSDLLIATQSANLGMAGPAMIEGGGLGVYAAEEVGPMAVQTTNGVVDCLVENEAEEIGRAHV